MRVRIRRQDGPGLESYWNTFECGLTGRVTVAAVLDYLNYNDDPVDVSGEPCRRIRWECGCMQKLCGGCAMVINRQPALACNTFIDCDSEELLTLEPLTKFEVVTDLIVDRSCIQESLIAAEAYRGEFRLADESERSWQYQAAKCLKCGLCLEVCPNYTGSSGRRGNFHGAVLANEAYLLHSSSENRQRELRREYGRHFDSGCSRSLACRDVCPMKIPTLSSIGYMNRQFFHKNR